MSKGLGAPTRVSLMTRHAQISRSALNLHGNRREIERAFQQLQRLRKLVVQAEHSDDGGLRAERERRIRHEQRKN